MSRHTSLFPVPLSHACPLQRGGEDGDPPAPRGGWVPWVVSEVRTPARGMHKRAMEPVVVCSSFRLYKLLLRPVLRQPELRQTMRSWTSWA